MKKIQGELIGKIKRRYHGVILLLITCILYGILNTSVNASINLTVSPTKYEVEALKGTTIIKKATLYNYSKDTYTITTGKANFTTDGKTGIPKIVRKKDLLFPDQQLSSWLEIETESFIISPGEKKDIRFAINIPNNATPGGHYGAVFFKKSSSKNSSQSSEIGVNVDYGILIMVNVDGKVIMKGAPEDITITFDNKLSKIEEDSCFFYDFTSSNFDGKCISWPFSNDTDLNSAPDESLKNFNTNFGLKFKNEGNTHIKPTGEIVLIDGDGNKLTGIGQEIIKNKRGAVIGEKIVDYLPINDVGGNVLPYSTRNFKLTWQGFSYKTYDDNGNEIIKYWSPSEYYTKKNIDSRGFIMFWERYSERINNEKITALINLSYKDKKGEKIEFNSAKEFYINYKESYIGYNPYIIIIMIIIGIILIIIYIIKTLNKKECRKCGKKIDKKLKACIYCGKKVKSKK